MVFVSGLHAANRATVDPPTHGGRTGQAVVITLLCRPLARGAIGLLPTAARHAPQRWRTSARSPGRPATPATGLAPPTTAVGSNAAPRRPRQPQGGRPPEASR